MSGSNAPLSLFDPESEAPDADDLPFHLGDHVRDREAEDSATMLVTRIHLTEARNHRIKGDRTVADYNPDYPADDEVITVVFPARTDTELGPLKSYAYPASRLELEAPIHGKSVREALILDFLTTVFEERGELSGNEHEDLREFLAAVHKTAGEGLFQAAEEEATRRRENSERTESNETNETESNENENR